MSRPPGGPAVGLLGPVTLLVDGQNIPLGGRKPRIILALLAAQVGNVVSSDRLGEAAWGEAAVDRSPTTLQVHVSGLRKALGPAGSALVAVTPGYRLAVDEVTIDADEFERSVAAARGHAVEGRVEDGVGAYDDGLRWWRGRAMGDLDDVLELEGIRHRLDALRLTAIIERNDLLLALGRHDELVPDLERLVLDHPFREDFLGQLMLALYRSGRQADALRAFQEARRRLGEDLGLEPGPSVARLEQSILLHSPSIELPTASDEPGLRWIDGDGHARRHRLDPTTGNTVVGRAEEATIRLDHDPAVSRHHAVLDYEDGCWWVTDPDGSTNGSFVNGARVDGRAVLADGDVLRCGETVLLVQLDPEFGRRRRVTVGNVTISIPDA